MNNYNATETPDFKDFLRNEILAEDIIKILRPSLEIFAAQVRAFTNESMIRGFDRTFCKNSIAVFLAEIFNFIGIAENSIKICTSQKARILDSDLQALKTSLGVFVRALEKKTLEKPDLQKQMLVNEMRKIK